MSLPVLKDQVLIDAGPSEAGWSRVESFLRCERLYFLLHKAPGHEQHWIKDVLVRGSIGHVGLAHEYARRTLQKQGKDPNYYYDRDRAMELAAEKFGPMGKEMLEIAQPVVEAYFKKWDATGEVLDVIGVEYPVEATLAGGQKITQRLDLVWRDVNGQIYITDHKLTSTYVGGQGVIDRYSLSGQFLLMQHFGRAYFGNKFGGTRINLLGCREPYAFKRVSPESSPAALAEFPTMIVETKKRIVAKDGQPMTAYLPSYNEQVCVTAYGRCSMFEVCQWGAR